MTHFEKRSNFYRHSGQHFFLSNVFVWHITTLPPRTIIGQINGFHRVRGGMSQVCASHLFLLSRISSTRFVSYQSDSSSLIEITALLFLKWYFQIGASFIQAPRRNWNDRVQPRSMPAWRLTYKASRMTCTIMILMAGVSIIMER